MQIWNVFILRESARGQRAPRIQNLNEHPLPFHEKDRFGIHYGGQAVESKRSQSWASTQKAEGERCQGRRQTGAFCRDEPYGTTSERVARIPGRSNFSSYPSPGIVTKEKVWLGEQNLLIIK